MLLSPVHFGDRSYTDMTTQLSKFRGYRVTKPVTSDLCRSSLVLLWYDFERTDRTPHVNRTRLRLWYAARKLQKIRNNQIVESSKGGEQVTQSVSPKIVKHGIVYCSIF